MYRRKSRSDLICAIKKSQAFDSQLRKCFVISLVIEIFICITLKKFSRNTISIFPSHKPYIRISIVVLLGLFILFFLSFSSALLLMNIWMLCRCQCVYVKGASWNADRRRYCQNKFVFTNYMYYSFISIISLNKIVHNTRERIKIPVPVYCRQSSIALRG